MTTISPYINFNGSCAEAMTYYQQCLGGELILQTIKGSPIETQCPPAMQDQIMHSSLTKDGFCIMASDMTGPAGYTRGNDVSILINCSSEGEINSYYDKISAGGYINDPLKVQFWGAMFADFTDKFGIRWMLIYDKNAH